MFKGNFKLEDVKTTRKDLFNSPAYLIFMTITGIASIWGLVFSLVGNSIPVNIIVIASLIFFFLGFLYILTTKNKEIRELSEKHANKINSMEDECINCRKLEVTSEGFHDFTHNIRNEVYQITRIWDTKSYNAASLDANLKSCSNIVLNYLEKILTEHAKQQASVNLKVFEPKNVKKLSYKKWYVSTLCRSINSNSDRKKFDSKSRKSVEYTEFDLILSGTLDTFSVQNLKDFEQKVLLEQKIAYKNPCNSWNKYYCSRIVSPIRISGQLIPKSFGITEKNVYHVMGFITVDFEKEMKDISTLKNCTKITQAFADALYEYLEKCSFYRLSLK